jgi:phosphoglycerol transferase MdoB-like AlkP superfamily enzyme
MGLIIGLVFLPLYLILKHIKSTLGIFVIKILFSSIAIIQLALIGYSLTTHINLGADLIGYSFNDIYTTVTSSISISFLLFLPFIIVTLLYLGLHKLFNRLGHKISTAALLLGIFIFGSLNLLVASTTKPTSQNKLHFLIADIIRSKKDQALASESNVTYKQEFPLEKPFADTKDVLAPFFNIHAEKPNIVFIIVEGLGSDFIDKGEYNDFTPYLDSLTSKSLYWENFLSNAGRTFGALPSIMGSLPFGENGFMEINELPKHNSLISILKSNGYTSSYYCGDDSNFERKNNFLEYNGIDNIIDINKFGPSYVATKKNEGGFSWGYPDSEIFRKTLSEIKDKKQPRLDIIMTLSNHEPFEIPSKSIYLDKVERILKTKSSFEREKRNEYKDIFAALLYTDNSIKNFMEAYSKKPEYSNTIFIITGDHRLIPIPQKDNLSRFHVPLYIFSPMLKKTEKFKSISSHRDITPSLVSFLINNYKFNKLEKTSWLGQGLDTEKQFRSTQNISFMRYKGSINDYIYQDYFYSDGSLFKIDENLNISDTDNNMLEKVSNSFDDFKKLNIYLTSKNKINTNATSSKKPSFEFTKEELATIQKLTKGLDSDQAFLKARDLAFNKERKNARLICNYILNKKPDAADTRTLKGRTLAWDGDYKNAEIELLEVIKRTPFYTDSYLALLDIYWWSNQNKKGIAIAQKALGNQIKDAELGYKLAQAYDREKNINGANKTIDSLLKIYPKKIDYLNFKKSLKK